MKLYIEKCYLQDENVRHFLERFKRFQEEQKMRLEIFFGMNLKGLKKSLAKKRKNGGK